MTMIPILHDLSYDIVHILRTGILGVPGGNQEGVDAMLAVVKGHLTLGIREQTAGAAITQTIQSLARQYIRKRQHLMGFAGGIAEHHALVTGTEFLVTIAINALCNVRALAGDVHGDIVLGQILVSVVAEQNVPGQRLAVRFMLSSVKGSCKICGLNTFKQSSML